MIANSRKSGTARITLTLGVLAIGLTSAATKLSERNELDAASRTSAARRTIEVDLVAREVRSSVALPSFWASLTEFHFTDAEAERQVDGSVLLPIETDSEAELRVRLDAWNVLVAELPRAASERRPIPLDARLILRIDDELGIVTIDNAQYLGPRSAVDSYRRSWFGCSCMSLGEGHSLDHPRFQFQCVTEMEDPPEGAPRRRGPGFLTIAPDGSAALAAHGELDTGKELTPATLMLGRADDGDWWLWFEDA